MAKRLRDAVSEIQEVRQPRRLPISFALDTLGDRCSLPIVRAMIDLGQKPDGAFFAVDEGMATNILAGGLAHLVQARMLAKKSYATDQRKEVYRLAEKRVAFMPSLREVANGSARQVWIDMVNGGKAMLTGHDADQLP